ncbi:MULTISPECIES: hypothetical protein [Paraburkholderia]|uniref:Nmad3 family putative nucleotide modification protein n=1 Tax=Paraburkholderia phenoliruptrix TaxID=252970 RepID=UPI001C6F3104|nr:hypothetical protein [Paraburkholderia phenoliruptrix]MBW9132979.1 hypothetical protein [Paraburkholderia ginsengiterrae]
MPETKILFLRVGIDRGCDGRLSPIEAGGRFEYMPIPEGGAGTQRPEIRRHSVAPGRHFRASYRHGCTG